MYRFILRESVTIMILLIRVTRTDFRSLPEHFLEFPTGPVKPLKMTVLVMSHLLCVPFLSLDESFPPELKLLRTQHR